MSNVLTYIYFELIDGVWSHFEKILYNTVTGTITHIDKIFETYNLI